MLGAALRFGSEVLKLITVYAAQRGDHKPAPAEFDFQAAVLDAQTCPATCPPPSLAFCAGPLLDKAGFVIEAARGYFPAFCFGFVCVVLGFLIGRCSVPEPVYPPPRRPHGSRLGETDVARRPAN